MRHHSGHDARYSIVGTIFAFASALHREKMMFSALAPLQEWDALICSSPTLRETVERTFEVWEEYLRQRLGQLISLGHSFRSFPLEPKFRRSRFSRTMQPHAHACDQGSALPMTR